MAVKGALAKGLGGLLNMGADLDDNWGAEGEVGDEVAVPEGGSVSDMNECEVQ